MTSIIRLWSVTALLLTASACNNGPENIAPEDSALSEEEQIEKGAQTLEEAADKAMQIEIDALNNVAPAANNQSDDKAKKDAQSEDGKGDKE